ncbi:hypothetical protein CR159_12780 [Pollutimonas subterranea]|uniref:Uncharacterized protein n=1 Tax=Pollutimonas subterranea TaxID=2045210 RepID=A0A2N4U3A5_9BURK|nr:hypothetical protein [Pollutimonas subterranea]PLC49473.1 hypothetical protein CR159_12780 [Pollutimonas subterranea]
MAQQGQALVEGLIVLLVLLSLWVGVAWLGRLQDMALQATHASRYVAFALSRDPGAHMEADMRRHYFSGPAHQWSDRRGDRLLSPKLDEVALHIERQTVLAAPAQAGRTSGNAGILRRQWHIEDTGILASTITVAPRSRPVRAVEPTSVTGLSYFDHQQLALRRHTAILTGAGHASSDTAAQQVVADSALAWSQSASASYALGANIAGAMSAVDAAWNRPEPNFDWLAPWAGQVPDTHLGSLVHE